MTFFLVLVNGLFVFYFFVRELRDKLSKNHFSREEMTKIGILFFCFQFLNFIFFIKFHQFFLCLISLYLPILIFVYGQRINNKIREKHFSKEFHHFLRGVSLCMRVGNSFRYSLKDSYHLLSPRSKLRVQAIVELVVFSQHKKLDPKVDIDREIFREFSQIDKSPHQGLQRIDLWLQRVEKNLEFRHKSGQILQQLYIQTGIMSLMYIALFTFVVKKYGFIQNIKLILFSFSLFMVGTLLCFKIGKKIKWSF